MRLCYLVKLSLIGLSMDICLLEKNKNIHITPLSIHGMLWLQTHFEEEHWDAIASNLVRVSKIEAQELCQDAIEAGIKLNLLEKLPITKKF